MERSSLHVRWADEDEALSVVSDDSEHCDGISTQRGFSSSGAKDVKTVFKSTCTGDLDECVSRRSVPHLSSRCIIEQALPISSECVSPVGTPRQDTGEPRNLRSFLPLSAETASVDHDGGHGGVQSATRSRETSSVTAPMHTSTVTLSPETSTALRYSPAATSFHQPQRGIVETHLDSRDRREHPEFFSSTLSSRASTSFSRDHTAWAAIFEAKERRETHSSSIAVGTLSLLSPSACYTSSDGSSESPETFAVFGANMGRNWPLPIPLHAHVSTPNQQPRARCGCCGVTIQVTI